MPTRDDRRKTAPTGLGKDIVPVHRMGNSWLSTAENLANCVEVGNTSDTDTNCFQKLFRALLENGKSRDEIPD